MAKTVLVALLSCVACLTGCAHSITVEPDIGKLALVPRVSQPITAHVGYLISAENAALEVTTQGGGGDNVRYFPYRDIEPGLQSMLRNVFLSVDKVSGLSGNRIDYVIVPTIVTSSGGSGLFTWPPTNFTVDLTCTIRDAAGTQVATPRVVGTGSAETGERLHDHAFAGRRAMEDALIKMQAALLEVKYSGAASTGATPPPSPAPGAVPKANSAAADRLSQLNDLKAKGLINNQEYEAKRKAILDSL